jgi:hypothetical protein
MRTADEIEKIIRSCQIDIEIHRYCDSKRKEIRDSCNIDIKDAALAIEKYLLLYHKRVREF